MQPLKTRVFKQTNPAILWEIKHDLNTKPLVQVLVNINNALVAILPQDILYLDNMTVHVVFSIAYSGEARLV